MPGHIGGPGFVMRELNSIAKMDVTEVPGVDDLHLPVEVIEEGQQLLAEAFGAKQSYFLVNGATSGIQSLLLSMNPGSRILIARNFHKSLFGGMVLSGALPEYIPCEIDEETGIAFAVSKSSIEESLRKNENIGALFVTSPTYYGTVSDIKSFLNEAVKRDVLLFVDEAHGSHFPFHSAYPDPAIKSGADAVVNGLHKTLPVLNQGACLHLANRFNKEEKVKAAFSLLTTTSPSYPILASIDLARQFMQENGEKYLDKALLLSNEYQEKINQLKGIRCHGGKLKNYSSVAGLDPLKLLISIRGLDIDGYQLAELLCYKYNIQIEMQETNIILAMISMFHDREDWDKLYYALSEITEQYASASYNKAKGNLAIPPHPHVRLSPREAYFAKKRRLRFTNSCGEISAEMIASYPPGIPCLLPGEEITVEIYSYINYLKRSGARLHGPQDQNLNYINIIDH